MKAILCDLAPTKPERLSLFSTGSWSSPSWRSTRQRAPDAGGNLAEMLTGKQPWALPGDLLVSGRLKNQMPAFSPPPLRYRTRRGDLGADTLESVQSRTRIRRGHQADAPSLTQGLGSASGGCKISRQHLACSFLLPPTYLVKLLLHSCDNFSLRALTLQEVF